MAIGTMTSLRPQTLSAPASEVMANRISLASPSRKNMSVIEYGISRIARPLNNGDNVIKG